MPQLHLDRRFRSQGSVPEYPKKRTNQPKNPGILPYCTDALDQVQVWTWLRLILCGLSRPTHPDTQNLAPDT